MPHTGLGPGGTSSDFCPSFGLLKCRPWSSGEHRRELVAKARPGAHADLLHRNLCGNKIRPQCDRATACFACISEHSACRLLLLSLHTVQTPPLRAWPCLTGIYYHPTQGFPRQRTFFRVPPKWQGWWEH